MVLININTKQNLSLAFRKKIFCLKKKGGPSRIGSSLQASPQAGKLDKGPGIV